MATLRLRLNSNALMEIAAGLDDYTSYIEEPSPPNERNGNSSNNSVTGFEGASCSSKTSEISVDKNRIKVDDKEFSHIPADIRETFLEILYYDGEDIPEKNIDIPRKVKTYLIEYLFSQYDSKKLAPDDIVNSKNPYIKFVSYDAITLDTEKLLNKFCPGRRIRYK